MALINTSQTPLMSTLHSKPSAPSFFEYLGAAVEGTWDRNPLQLWRRQANIYEAQYGSEEISDLVGAAESDGLTFDVSELPQLQVKNELSLEQQKEYLVKHSTRAWLDSASDAGTPSLADSREALRRYRAGEMSEEEMALGVPGLYPEKEGWTYEDQLQDLENKYTEQVLKDYGIKPEERLNAEALDIILQARMNDRKNADIRERAPAWMTPFGLAADFATAMFDPIILGSGIIIPSAAASNFYLRSLQEAGTMTVGNAIKRAGVRFSAGALEGMAATALIETMNIALSKSQQFEYGALDSLTNIAAGGILGGMFRSVGGWWGERVRAKRGQRQEWHVAVPDAESEALRDDFQKRVTTAFREAGASVGEDEAAAAAALMDARARTWAFDTGKKASDYYADNPIEFNGRLDSDASNTLSDTLFSVSSPGVHGGKTRVRFAEFLDVALGDKAYAKTITLTEVSPWEVERIKAVSGLDVTGLKHTINANELRHLLDNHGVGGKKAGRSDNIPVTRADLDRIPEILAHPDDIEFEGVHKGRVSVSYKKEFPDGEVCYISRVFENNNSKSVNSKNEGTPRMSLRSFWKYPGRHVDSGNSAAPHSSIQTDAALKPKIELKTTGVNGEPKGRVSFQEDGKAVIEFFKSADASTAPHELYHVFRREMGKTASDPSASPQAKADWAAVEDFVGAKPGEAWTTEMEEMFARAGERFLMEGVAPHPTLDDTFSRMKEWFTEIYTNADDAGLEISPAMRKVFGDALRLDATDADIAFKYHLGSMVDDSDAAAIRTDFDAPERKAGETYEQYQERLTVYERDTEVQYREALENIKQEDSVEGRQLLAELEQEKAALTSEAEALEMRRQAMLEAAMCDVRKG